jgi:hypothetical protein
VNAAVDLQVPQKVRISVPGEQLLASHKGVVSAVRCLVRLCRQIGTWKIYVFQNVSIISLGLLMIFFFCI